MNKGERIDGWTPAVVVDGVPVRYERRRYGRSTFFCWAYAHWQGAWRSLGDPWQKVTPSRLDLAEAVRTLRDA